MKPKCYKKSDGVYVWDFPENQKQYEAKSADNTIENSSYSQEELDAMEANFFGGDMVGLAQNAVIREKKKVELPELEALVLALDALNV